jgi:hypothetical protein
LQRISLQNAPPQKYILRSLTPQDTGPLAAGHKGRFFFTRKNLIKPNRTSLFLIGRPAGVMIVEAISKMIYVMQCPSKLQMLHVTFETSRTKLCRTCVNRYGSVRSTDFANSNVTL